MTGNEIRREFLSFFEARGHRVVPSASLVPDDPTILTTIAGMVPFKPIFQGKVKPTFTRATSCQKCVRTNDIENVGRTARHHTFFEMLGNFSFGDYFKREAINWAWEFLTVNLGLPQDKLWVSVYKDDNEAFSIWKDEVGIPAERIVRLGADSNFWAAGPVGPCGPCSEIYIDLGEGMGCGQPDCGVGCDCDRYLEIWNLVFMEFNRDEAGNLSPLPKKNIDTGMGLERIASVLQHVRTNFDTDLLKPIMEYVAGLAGKDLANLSDADAMSLKVIADHIRAIYFLISDGVLPSNEGRGYVLRRILRRAVRHGKLLGINALFLYLVAGQAIDAYVDAYPELGQKKDYILRVIKIEEERFQQTLDQGMEILNQVMQEVKAKGAKTISGDDVFKLYDTYGFPLELTAEITREQSLDIDVAGFKAALEEQRERARAAQKTNKQGLSREIYDQISELPETKFVGYGTTEHTAQVLLLLQDKQVVAKAQAGAQVELILDETPFYAESGGQVGDTGVLIGDRVKVEIMDTKKIAGGKFVHVGRVVAGVIETGDRVKAMVDQARRKAIARNHTATHLVHRALRDVLGEHVHQAGSMVAADRFRFDFSHFSAVTPAELAAVEQAVNAQALASIPVEVFETSLAEAKAMGATALFGEKYGDRVRIVKIGDYSLELCGGTHLRTTGEIGAFKIIAEEGIGAGMRRVEAITGENALRYFTAALDRLDEVAQKLKAKPEELPQKVDALLAMLKEKEKEIEVLQGKLIKNETADIITKAVDVDGVKVIGQILEGLDMEALRNAADAIRDRIGSGVVILGTATEGKVNLVTVVTKDLLSRGLHAGKLIKEVAAIVGGGGGGRPEMAQAGGKNPAKLPDAMAQVPALVKAMLA